MVTASFRRHGQAVTTFCGHQKLALGLGPNTVLLHQALNLVFAYADATCQQFTMHTGPAVFLLHLRLNGSHVSQQGLVAETPSWARLTVKTREIMNLFLEEVRRLGPPGFEGLKG